MGVLNRRNTTKRVTLLSPSLLLCWYFLIGKLLLFGIKSSKDQTIFLRTRPIGQSKSTKLSTAILLALFKVHFFWVEIPFIFLHLLDCAFLLSCTLKVHYIFCLKPWFLHFIRGGFCLDLLSRCLYEIFDPSISFILRLISWAWFLGELAFFRVKPQILAPNSTNYIILIVILRNVPFSRSHLISLLLPSRLTSWWHEYPLRGSFWVALILIGVLLLDAVRIQAIQFICIIIKLDFWYSEDTVWAFILILGTNPCKMEIRGL